MTDPEPLAAVAPTGRVAAVADAANTSRSSAVASGPPGRLMGDDLQWQRALRLRERAGLAWAAAGTTAAFDRALGRRRTDRWRTQAPFSDGADGADPSRFERRLRADGVAPRQLQRLLGEAEASLRRRIPRPAWADELAAALSYPSEELPDAALGDAGGAAAEDVLRSFAPLLAHAVAELRREAGELSGGLPAPAFDADAFAAAFSRLLATQLRTRLMRVLAVELHIDSREGRLGGELPAERFRAFLRSFAGPSRRLDLLAHYPVLGRLLAVCVRHWIGFGVEVLGHLVADRDAIVERFFDGRDPGPATGLETETGDLHRQGRCVLILRFASGERLVYKPKPIAVDRHFQELLGWVNERGAEPRFRRLRVLDRADYGWEEFAAPAECASPDEVERFYRRIGGLLALLYLVDATDFHLENLIAAGEHPMLVDLESLFHGRAQRAVPGHAAGTSWRAMEDSVLRCGLLPQRRQSGGGAEAPDVSGLWGAADQWSAEPMPHWLDVGTDAMRLARDRLRMPGAANRPRLAGAEADVLDHGPAILAGLRSMYLLLLDRREELLSPQGPLAAFRSDQVRIILRATMVYAKLLTEGFHPHVLGSALELDRHFDRLWLASVEQPFLETVIASEQRDLWQGDVPVFTAQPGSRDLWDSRGLRFPDFLDAASLDTVLDRVHRLSLDDLERQTWFARASLATLVANSDDSHQSSYELSEQAPPAGEEELRRAALEIGGRLEMLAMKGEDDAAWWGLALLDGGWSLVHLGWDLYGGLLGIALFLAYLAETAGAARFGALAEAALNGALRLLAADAPAGEGDGPALPATQAGIGAFNGLGGAIYALCHLARLWRRPQLLAEAQTLAGRLAARVAGDRGLDVMSGAAGAVASLLVLEEMAPGGGALASAVACGDLLLAAAQPAPAGLGWSKRAGEPPLSGFSHGAAGIAWALARLGAATGDARYGAAARQALRYERSLYLPELGNWRDLRQLEIERGRPAGEVAPMWAWCHGAPGIGLARLGLRHCLDDAELGREAEAAIASTLAQGFGHNHSLCHGDLGNLELLLVADRELAPGRWRGQIERHAAMVLAGIRSRGWLCGVPEGLETPGLMTGLAGIGYGLLRLADPDRLPSLLTLEPPRPDVHP